MYNSNKKNKNSNLQYKYKLKCCASHYIASSSSHNFLFFSLKLKINKKIIFFNVEFNSLMKNIRFRSRVILNVIACR